MQHESIKKKVVGVVAPVAVVALYKGRKDASSGDEATEKTAKEHGERHDQGRSKVPSDSGKVRIAGSDGTYQPGAAKPASHHDQDKKETHGNENFSHAEANSPDKEEESKVDQMLNGDTKESKDIELLEDIMQWSLSHG